MILVIDTSLPGIGLAYSPSLAKGCRECGGVVVKKIETSTQSLGLQTAVPNFLAENNIQFSDIHAIGVVVGPGSFTGIRLGIAYAKGLGIGLKIPVVPVNAFEIYMERDPDAFVAIDSGRGDFFIASAQHTPGIMTINEVETEQMKCPKTVGHKPYDLADVVPIVMRKLGTGVPAFTGMTGGLGTVIPMYMRPSYVETNCKSS